MRSRFPLGHLPVFAPEVLRSERTFLYRRVLDQQRRVLGVGEVSVADRPTFDRDGKVKDWAMGHLTYEALHSIHDLPGDAAQDFPSSRWFIPRWVIEWQGDDAVLFALPGDEAAGLAFGQKLKSTQPSAYRPDPIEWTSGTDQGRYLERVDRFLQHIQRGDIYEVNYCIQRKASDPSFDPFVAFAQLDAGTDAPFSAFYRLGDRFALCASPERFLGFKGDHVLAEPMKGTRPRGADPKKDAELVEELANDPKERSENIMAVDVMRNDLSMTAAPGTVEVRSLCEVRTYPRVHQLVSAIVSERAADRDPWDVVRAAFPMASMTGAPKLRAMQLIAEAEDQPRGLYSGTLGFFAPDGTADLNVVIRTILFDRATGDLSLSTGSALTALCHPAQEWEECALKAHSVLNVLGHVG
ncbi:MAG: anthranilate synthase component I family protein [Flavobacteriales bacterium]|nr:anthranilate synthase component I family protein [Flavobacteriales bacterium]